MYKFSAFLPHSEDLLKIKTEIQVRTDKVRKILRQINCTELIKLKAKTTN